MLKKAQVILALTAIMLSGCATSVTYQYDYKPKNIKVSFQLIDERPDNEKYGEVMSALVTSDQYGIYRIGDNQVVPDRFLYLSERIENMLSGRLNEKILRVKSFEIFNNQQKYRKGVVFAGAVGGLIGSALDASTDKNSDAYIDINLNIYIQNKSYEAIVRRGYSINKWKGISSEQLADEIKKAMDSAIDKIVQKIDASGETSV